MKTTVLIILAAAMGSIALPIANADIDDIVVYPDDMVVYPEPDADTLVIWPDTYAED
ncbi:hypothetical protein VMCG_01223 [Cytospora schulzeri]|uniref:Uncharacterized protein n=1 Tax=Cytospora schulzeri TaxID=448051 RepID=A0A423X689_9PEZI|nr:hypothetical protein VMCG_01223 [Valsa malicola]